MKEILIQACSYCNQVEAVLVFDKKNPAAPPTSPEWTEGIFGDAREYEGEKEIEVEYIGYCSVDCEIEDKGWPE